MSEENAQGRSEVSRKGHPVLLTLLTLLCFLGLLAYRVWYSSMYLNAAANPRYLYFSLAEAAAALILLLIVLSLRQDFMLSAGLPLCFIVLVFMLLSFFSSFRSGYSRWLSIGPVMLYLPPFLLLLLFPLSAFTAAGRPVSAGRGFLIFLVLGVVPVGLMFLSGELEYVTVYLLVCILFAFYIHKNNVLDMPGALFWLVTLLVLAAIIALYGFRIWKHFDVLYTRGHSDPEGYGVLLMQVDSIWQQIRWLGPSPLLSEVGATPWYTVNAGYELIAVMIRGGAVAGAGMLLCALGLVVCLYRMHSAMRSSFARFVSFLAATVFLVETVWNLLSAFLGISARSDIPFLTSDRAAFAIEIILLAAVFTLFRQRRIPVVEMEGDYWFRGSVDAPEEPAPAPRPETSYLRDPALRKYLHPDRFYLDLRMEMAGAEWSRIQEDALADGHSLPENLNEELLPLCILDEKLFLLIPSHSPRAEWEDPAADLAALLGRTPYELCFIYEDPLQNIGESPEDPAEASPDLPDASEEAEQARLDEVESAISELSFAGPRKPTEIPDFSFTPQAQSGSDQ